MSKYSIILPVRNGGEYVKDCINSILGQTIPHFNLLVLDNQSTDGTSEWLRSISDERVRIYPSDRPLTIEENWSRIRSLPRNEFMTMTGHDDMFDPHYLEVMERLIEKHPDAGLYQTHFSYIDAEGKPIRSCKPMDEIQYGSDFLSALLSHKIDIMGTGFMMRATDYDAVGGIPDYPNLLFADFALFVSLAADSYKATAPDKCFSFRLHRSMTTTSPDIRFQKAFGRFISFLKAMKEKNSDFEKAVASHALQYIAFYCKSLSHRLLRTPGHKREGLGVAAFMKQCKEWADQLVPGNDFDPEQQFSIKLAKLIDNSSLLRTLFLLFKKVYARPVYS